MQSMKGYIADPGLAPSHPPHHDSGYNSTCSLQAPHPSSILPIQPLIQEAEGEVRAVLAHSAMVWG